MRRFEGSKVRIVALSITDSAECAFVRFLLSHPEQGREILERAGLALIESDLIGVELPEGPQPLLQVCTALLQAEVNIVQAYPLLVRPHGRPAVALMVDNIEMGMETLAVKGLHDDHRRRSGRRRIVVDERVERRQTTIFGDLYPLTLCGTQSLDRPARSRASCREPGRGRCGSSFASRSVRWRGRGADESIR